MTRTPTNESPAPQAGGFETVMIPVNDHKTKVVSEDYVRGARDGAANVMLQQFALLANRDLLGRLVREAWVKWAYTQEAPKANWLLPYDELAECDKEADRQIGEAVIGWAKQYAPAAMSAPAPQPPVEGLREALEPWRDELTEIIGHLGAAIIQSTASDDQIIMDHVKAAHEIAKIVRRKA